MPVLKRMFPSDVTKRNELRPRVPTILHRFRRLIPLQRLGRHGEEQFVVLDQIFLGDVRWNLLRVGGTSQHQRAEKAEGDNEVCFHGVVFVRLCAALRKRARASSCRSPRRVMPFFGFMVVMFGEFLRASQKTTCARRPPMIAVSRLLSDGWMPGVCCQTKPRCDGEVVKKYPAVFITDAKARLQRGFELTAVADIEKPEAELIAVAPRQRTRAADTRRGPTIGRDCRRIRRPDRKSPHDFRGLAASCQMVCSKA